MDSSHPFCSRCLLNLVACVMVFLPTIVSAFERIENRWKPDQVIQIHQGALMAGPATAGFPGAEWQSEPVGDGSHVRLRNRSNGGYLHIETGKPEAGRIQPGWWSAQWLIEPVSGGDFVRLRNRWKPDQYLHIERGRLEAGAIKSGWLSAQWRIGQGGGARVALPALPVDNGFYVIAHMVNTPNAVDWAVREGSNAAEVDLEFTLSGEPKRFYHGGVCDCFCTPGGVCAHLGGSNPCEASTTVSALLSHMARKQALTLIIIDSKAGNLSGNALSHAGSQVVKQLDASLFGNGYNGIVIIGVPKTAQLDYLRAAATAVASSPNKSRYWFSIDQESDQVGGALGALATLPTTNRVFGTGITACGPGSYEQAISLAAANERAGVSSLTYIWTIDKESSMVAYMQAGARGIMTNQPGKLSKLAAERGMRLVRPGGGLPATSSSSVKTSLGRCDCDYAPGGCFISAPAPANQACKCKYRGAWTCGGDVVACSNPLSPQCLRPDGSIRSCTLGGGDCGGYQKAACDCDYAPGGCKIVKAAPSMAACRCSYKGAWTCGGHIVQCSNEGAGKCRSPDTSKASCLLGGGDCGAY